MVLVFIISFQCFYYLCGIKESILVPNNEEIQILENVNELMKLNIWISEGWITEVLQYAQRIII